MTRSRRLALALLAAVPALFAAAAPSHKAGPARSIAVFDARQLAAAIGSDRTIVLGKGDYRLSSAYGIKSECVSWTGGGEGKELSIAKVESLTIRGSEGARIVSDSSGASMIGIYDSKDVTIDNIVFSRIPRKGAEAAAGSLYAESVSRLSLDRCSFEGPAAVAIELWECIDASIKRVDIEGAVSGAVSASYTEGLELVSGRVAGCRGYPLLCLEESDGVLFKGLSFEGNSGGNFVEVYAGEADEPSVRFEDCAFKGEDFEYFVGSARQPSALGLPSTEGCRFEDSSFGEDWRIASVAPASEGGPYAEEGPTLYEHSSGLSFQYAPAWRREEYLAKERVGVFAPDGKSLVFMLTAYAVPAKVDTTKRASQVFADAGAALVKALKDELDIKLFVKADGEPYADNGLLSADYSGRAAKGEGEIAQARVRLVCYGGSVQAMVGLAADASALDAGGEIDGIFDSIRAAK